MTWKGWYWVLAPVALALAAAAWFLYGFWASALVSASWVAGAATQKHRYDVRAGLEGVKTKATERFRG